jgi:GntR family transcriptional regulator
LTGSEGATLYQGIEKWLRDEVLNGREGDILPSEVELAEQFGVSRMTARQAMQNLAAEGLVRRKRGAGTFISRQPFHRHSGPLMSFTADMRRRGLVASSKLISAEVRFATVAEVEALKLDEGARVVSIIRLRLADSTPMAIENATLTLNCASVLAENLETGSLHSALAALGRTPSKALSWISARQAEPSEAKLLELPSKSPALVERRIIIDQDDEPLEFTTTVYHPERYIIDAVFTLVPEKVDAEET